LEELVEVEEDQKLVQHLVLDLVKMVEEMVEVLLDVFLLQLELQTLAEVEVEELKVQLPLLQ
jgi:hypothetical protein